jgi:hypothetical protein
MHPAIEESLALRHHARIIRHRPGAEDLALRTMADPECGPVAEQCAGGRRRQNRPELQLAAGHQRAQGEDDGRARNQRPDHRDRLQQGGEEQREIGQPCMGRDERNQRIKE